jgi:Cu/Ag efflux protein CusF
MRQMRILLVIVMLSIFAFPIKARSDDVSGNTSNSTTAPWVTVTGVGVVVDTHPEFPALTVVHEEIKGFMSAMKMMYFVQSADMLNGLKAGDKIRFTIDTTPPPTIKTIEVLAR